MGVGVELSKETQGYPYLCWNIPNTLLRALIASTFLIQISYQDFGARGCQFGRLLIRR